MTPNREPPKPTPGQLIAMAYVDGERTLQTAAGVVNIGVGVSAERVAQPDHARM